MRMFTVCAFSSLPSEVRKEDICWEHEKIVNSTQDPKTGLATAENAGGVDGAENWRSWDGRRW